MTEPQTSNVRPYWLRQTKRLFPHPAFSAVICLACSTVALIFVGVSVSVPGLWPLGLVSIFFVSGAFMTGVATFTSSRAAQQSVDSHDRSRSKPTFAIITLLIAIYTWALSIAMHLFRPLFKDGVGSTKYYLTLAIAISSTVFVQLYGKRIIRQHFRSSSDRRIVLTSGQAFAVVAFVVGCGAYITWVLS